MNIVPNVRRGDSTIRRGYQEVEFRVNWAVAAMVQGRIEADGVAGLTREGLKT